MKNTDEEAGTEQEAVPVEKKETVSMQPSTSMDALDPHTDPFAARDGKTLLWKNVNMVLVSSEMKGM
jgi:hypothetical protein